jgi:hypothetical protein
VGDLAKDSQKFAAAFVFSRERARERVSEFLSAIDISPLPILKRLSHSPKQKQNNKTQPSLALHGIHPSFIHFHPFLHPRTSNQNSVPNCTKFWSSLRSLLLPPSRLSALFFKKKIYLSNF